MRERSTLGTTPRNGGSRDVLDEKRGALLKLFPEARTEADKIDFDGLRMALGDMVDSAKERYGLTWPGKAACFKAIQATSMATLLPVPAQSVNFDTSANVIIEGDNLEVLKLLQKSYLGKVKIIYIDPPYNTGNDFIYPDNYSESLRTYLEYTGQIDSEGRKFGTNTDTDGRFHSKWLNMMYPRLYLARNMLRNDGLLFVSIDDNEVTDLRMLLNEVFGEENFLANIIWKKSYGGGAKVKHVVGLHEYILVYCRDKDSLPALELPPNPETLKYYKLKDAKFDAMGPYRTQPLATTSMDSRPNLRFAIPWNGEDVWPEKQWQWSQERVGRALANDELVFSKANGKWVVRYKQYLKDEHGDTRGAKPFTILEGPYTQDGSEEMKSLFGDNKIFEFPKPSALIARLLQYAGPEALILDFFAGSGSTAQAVLQLNEADGGNRRFILVQLPEKTDLQDYESIADITAERVRRVINKLNGGVDMPKLDIQPSGGQDRGFRLFKLAESNVKEWDASGADDADSLKKQLSLSVDHLRKDRTDLDVLYEVLLKSGFPLSSDITYATIGNSQVFSLFDGAFLICLERNLSLDLVRAIADRNPERVTLLDEGFGGNDQLKANAAQTFKSKQIVLKTLYGEASV